MKKKFLILALSLSMLISGKSIYANDVNKYALPEGYQFLESSFKFNGDSFSEGLSRVIDLETKKYGYIDETGKLVIPYQFNSIDKFGSFREGLVAVADGESYYTTQKYENVTIHGSYTNKYGYIDKSGNLVIPYQFVDASDFSEGLAAVQDPETYKWGYIDKSGNLVIPYQFVDASDFSEGLAAVRDPETYKWGYIDKSENLVIPYQFEDASDFSEGLAAVQDPETYEWGYIDKSGNLVIPYQFSETKNFSEELAAVQDPETEKYGYIDKSGNLVIPYQFGSASDFSEELATVQDPETYKYGYIDKSGNLVIPYQFVDAKNFMDGGMAIVGQHINESYNVFYGVIDKEGNMILPTKFNLNDGPSQSWGKLPGDIKDGIVSLKDPDTGKTIYISKSNDIETGNYIFYPRNGQQEEKIEISGFIDLKDLFKMSTIPNKEGHIFIGWFIGETKSSTLPGRENSKDYDTSFRENIVGLNGDSKFYAAYVNKDILDIEVDPNVNNYYEYSELYLNKDELEDFRYNEEARNLMFLLNTCKPLSSNYDKNVLATSDIDIFENNKFLLETYDIDKNNKLSKRDYYKMLDNKNDDYFEDKENNK